MTNNIVVTIGGGEPNVEGMPGSGIENGQTLSETGSPRVYEIDNKPDTAASLGVVGFLGSLVIMSYVMERYLHRNRD